MTDETTDFSADYSTSGSLKVGESATGTIASGSDEDWYAIQFEAGKIYQVDVEGADTDKGTLSNPNLTGIYEGPGLLVFGTGDDDSGTGLNSQQFYMPWYSFTFFVGVGSTDSEIGTYTVSVTVQDIDDFAATTATTGSVAVNGSTTGSIDAVGDEDWIAMSLTAGTTYQVDFEGSSTGKGTLENPWLHGLIDSSGTYIAFTNDDDSGEGLNARYSYTPSTSGTYYVAAMGNGGSTGTYTVSVSDSGGFADDTSTTGSVDVGGWTTASLFSGDDKDWIAVYLSAGTTYEINIEGADTGRGDLLDPRLDGIYDSSGSLISGTSDDDSGVGSNGRLTYTASTDGTYYLAVASSNSSNSGSYTIQVSETSGDDYAADTTTGASVVVGGSATGNIESAYDQDWFAVQLTAGLYYQIRIDGLNGDKGTLFNPEIFGLYDSSGTDIAGTTDSDSAGWSNALIEYAASSSGTYYIAAGAFYQWTGTYTVSVASSTVDDYGDTAATAGAIIVGGSATGTIEKAYDQDWFAVELTAGTTYRFDIEGAATGAGTLSDPYLGGLHDSSGTTLANTYVNDGGTGTNAQLNYTVTSSGTYYVGVNTFSADTGTYTLSVAETDASNAGSNASDDHVQNSLTSGVVAVGGSVSGAFESIYDRDWYAVALDAGTTYKLEVKGAASGGGTATEVNLFGIYDAESNMISGASDFDEGDSSAVVYYTPTVSGTYYVAASTTLDTGTYALEVTDQGSDNTALPDTGAESRVSVGEVKSGSIDEAYGRDWLAVDLEAGRDYLIELKGTSSGSGTLNDPVLYGVSGSSLQAVSSGPDDDGGVGRDSRMEVSITESGTYYIAAGGYGDDTGTYTLQVTDLTGSSGGSSDSSFNIVVNYDGDTTYLSYFEAAAATWEAVITADLADVTDPVKGVIDDLVIDASIVSIDGSGGVVGQAGPTAFRTDNALPYLGTMQFDSADLASQAANGTLQDLIEHEMGHVLGFGTLWNWFGLTSGGSYLGTNALARYSNLSGSTQTGVPLETTGGAGTAYVHWSEAVFDTELMTGYLESSPNMPLSSVTIGSLQDLGYTVNYDAAESFSPSTAAVAGASLAAGTSGTTASSVVATSYSAYAASYSGERYVSYGESALNISESSSPLTLDGTVTFADESTIFFFETVTGNSYLTELTGEFLKNAPSLASQVQGTVEKITFYADGKLVEAFDYSEETRDVQTTMSSWTGYETNLANYFESRSSTAQADNIRSGAGDDVLIGALGDDNLEGGAGADTIDGGSGTDTVFYSGGKASYSVSESGLSVVIADSTSSRDGTDVLYGVEQYSFSDGTFSLSDLIAPTSVADGIYRFYNVSTGTHFYTGSSDERNSVINTLDSFNYEGASFKAATGIGTTDVYRFYNSSTGTHFFTQSTEERDSVVANLPHFNLEGVAYQSYTEAVDGSIALYRFLNTSTGSHFYTPSESERDSVISTLPNYLYEGIAYYVDPI